MRTWLLFVASGVAAAILFACGGGGGESKPLTLEEYFQEVQALAAELNAGEEPILATLRNSENVEDLKGALAQYPDVVSAYLKELQKLTAPAEAAEAHATAVQASQEFQDAVKTAMADTRESTTVDGFFAAANAVQIAVTSQSMAVACDGLQQVADEHQVSVDLGCPAE